MATRPIVTSRSLAATGLAVVGIFIIGLMVALPALTAYNQKVDGQKLAGKVLAVCAQGGDAAAPLVALHACPLAQQVQSATPVATSSPTGLTHDEVQNMINEAIARQKPAAPVAPPPTTVPLMLPSEGGGSLGPQSPPGVAGQPGREQRQRPAPEEQVRSTEENRPPPLRQDQRRPYQFDYSGQRDQRGEDRYPPERTVTEQAPPPPVTVTEQAPAPTAAPAPAPVTQTVEQPQPAQQQTGTPLLNGLGGLLNGLGSGL